MKSIADVFQTHRYGVLRSSRGTLLACDNTRVGNGYSVQWNPDPTLAIGYIPGGTPWIAPEWVGSPTSIGALDMLAVSFCGLEQSEWEPV